MATGVRAGEGWNGGVVSRDTWQVDHMCLFPRRTREEQTPAA